MKDLVTSETRSRNMAAIHSKDTKPELFIRKLLFKNGFRYRLHSSRIPGKPDIFLRKYNSAIFINGCFWHQHKNCKNSNIPKTNTDFWIKKLNRNQERDHEVQEQLKEKKIKQLIIWECTVRKMTKDPDFQKIILEKIISFLNQSEIQFMEL